MAYLKGKSKWYVEEALRVSALLEEMHGKWGRIMGYIAMERMVPEYVWQAAKTMRVRPGVKRKNHMDIICHVEDKETQEIIQKEMHKAVRRMNCLLKSKVSFKEVIILEKDG